MTLQQILYVIKIADSGSMNKAAEELYISQPTLTAAVKELESELGIRVFARNARGTYLTADGEEFLMYARQLYQQYRMIDDRYFGKSDIKRRFAVSSQHYSFAVKAFVETVKQFDMNKYDLAFREQRTIDVIEDVRSLKSEIGVLYTNDFNRKILQKIFRDSGIGFHRLTECKAYVYLWKGHPLAKEKSISFGQLAQYPCLSFEQGEKGSFFFAEEILSTNEYPKSIKATDRSTMLNLMVGLLGYTLCSGIICEELNGSDFTAVPFESDDDNPNAVMQIGYIMRKDNSLSDIGRVYIDEIVGYLNKCTCNSPSASQR